SHDTPRLRTMLGGDSAAVAMAMLAIMTLPGAPCIYYGDELGMAGEMDPGCRGSIDWTEASWDRALLDAVRAAVALRREYPVLRHGSFEIVGASDMCVAWRRSDDATSLIVGLNAGDEPARLEVWVDDAAGRRLTDVGWDGGEPLVAELEV